MKGTLKEVIDFLKKTPGAPVPCKFRAGVPIFVRNMQFKKFVETAYQGARKKDITNYTLGEILKMLHDQGMLPCGVKVKLHRFIAEMTLGEAKEAVAKLELKALAGISRKNLKLMQVKDIVTMVSVLRRIPKHLKRVAKKRMEDLNVTDVLQVMEKMGAIDEIPNVPVYLDLKISNIANFVKYGSKNYQDMDMEELMMLVRLFLQKNI
uniref:Uncharacterized protein n=1 Tax=viral metagenome TaxID=1070528 RepID=A0A6C0KBD8_9ZZZZ